MNSGLRWVAAICGCALLLGGPAAAQSNEWKKLNQAASALHRQGHYDQAMVAAKRALEVGEHEVGPGHPDVVNPLRNLAALRWAQGQYTAAEPLYRRALAILKTAFGPDHPAVATLLENISALYTKLDRSEEAKNLADRAAKLRELKR